ncbi:hypothetical protein PIB30_049168 [Stylosanthes scabra]|uniref:Uncharacterized protein n=1 Tax=Stylosanthes scabra TaxID=79078 RepID=A0ABU6RI03_9FABA|nr:hypothetical protein [Stylosanthes scabra]
MDVDNRKGNGIKDNYDRVERKMIEVEMSEKQKNLLDRSLMADNIKPINFKALMEYVKENWIGPGKFECGDLGPHKCIITMESTKFRDEALSNPILLHFFDWHYHKVSMEVHNMLVEKKMGRFDWFADSSVVIGHFYENCEVLGETSDAI